MMTHNPYEAPRETNTSEPAGVMALERRDIARIVGLGASGFAFFSLLSAVMCPWAQWQIGLFYALMFALSESLRIRSGPGLHVFWRLGLILMLWGLSALVAEQCCYFAGWPSLQSDPLSDPYVIPRWTIFGATFVSALGLTRAVLSRC